MPIRVEFYGVPRLRAGLDAIDVPAGTLADVLSSIADRLPEFAASCLTRANDAGVWTAGPTCLLNLDGDRFVRESGIVLSDGATLLVLSADAGG